jgi:diguanylate cyclase (GGDEF)-like protein
MDTVPTSKTKRSVLTQTRVFMFCFGLIMGAVFPFFSLFLLSVSAEKVLTAKYFFACILAGLLVAFVSYLLVQLTIMKEILAFNRHVSHVTGNIQEYKKGNLSLDECADCYLEISSADALGEIQSGMNDLVYTIRSSFQKHELTDSYHRLLNQAMDVQQLFDTTLRYFSETIDAVIAGELFTYEESGLELKSSLFMHRQIPKNYYLFLQDVIDSRRVHVSEEASVLADAGHITEQTKGHLVFPVQNDREKLGALILYVSEPLAGDEIRHVNRLLKQFLLAYGNAKAYSQIKGMATYDELTGVYNRQHGMQLVTTEFNHCREESVPISLVMLDLDHFKQLNDTFGHPAGDMVLHTVASLIKESVRGRDLVVRYGGEEFVVVMPQTTRRDAGTRIEAILEKLKQMNLRWNNLPLSVSFSAGISSSESGIFSDYTLSSILQQADTALYNAKERGRNQVVIATG